VGLTTTRLRNREQGAAKRALSATRTPSADERLLERGAECSRLRAENVALKARIGELEQQIEALAARTASAAEPVQRQDQQRNQQQKRRG
jgi:predicted RNase H-like nuclease (RuvC/YqgF family)